VAEDKVQQILADLKFIEEAIEKRNVLIEKLWGEVEYLRATLRRERLLYRLTCILLSAFIALLILLR
jgi:hypothetical protein